MITVPATAAQVLYDATDPFSRRVVIDKGQLNGVQPGSPVMDESGVLGQVTRVYPFVSEVTLLIDRDQVIPVMNARTGQRAVAYGDATPRAGLLELRYMPVGEDVREGDELVTSGIDGVYPPGLPVAKVAAVDRRSDSSFARIYCTPLAQVQGVTYVMVLQPVTDQLRLAGVGPSATPASAPASAASAASAAAAASAPAAKARPATPASAAGKAGKPPRAGNHPKPQGGKP